MRKNMVNAWPPSAHKSLKRRLNEGSQRFHNCPSRDLLRNYEPSCWPSFEALLLTSPPRPTACSATPPPRSSARRRAPPWSRLLHSPASRAACPLPRVPTCDHGELHGGSLGLLPERPLLQQHGGGGPRLGSCSTPLDSQPGPLLLSPHPPAQQTWTPGRGPPRRHPGRGPCPAPAPAGGGGGGCECCWVLPSLRTSPPRLIAAARLLHLTLTDPTYTQIVGHSRTHIQGTVYSDNLTMFGQTFNWYIDNW